VIIDSTANILNIFSFAFSGLLGTTTASHIHCCTALPGVGTARVATQVPSFAGFPNGVTSGSYSMNFDMTQDATRNPAFITANGGTVTGAESVLAAVAAAGDAYLIFSSTRIGETKRTIENCCLISACAKNMQNTFPGSLDVTAPAGSRAARKVAAAGKALPCGYRALHH
jgi:hypothetical protein